LRTSSATIPKSLILRRKVANHRKNEHLGRRAQLGWPMFEGAPVSIARWVHRTLAAHSASLEALPADFCA